MSQDINNLPIYDPIIKKNTDSLSDIWEMALATLIQTLQDYLTSAGIFVPRLTQAQRDNLQNPQNGQLIYNATNDKFQGFESGMWKDLI